MFFLYPRVKPAIFDLLLAVCIAAYLGVAYVAVQVGEKKQEMNFIFLLNPISHSDWESQCLLGSLLYS